MNGAPVPVVQRDLLTSQGGLVAGRVGIPGCGLVLGLLSALHATDGLGPPGWAVGLTCGVLGNLWLVAAMIVHGRTRLGPADLVTLTRAALACGGAALVADSFTRPAQVTTLVWLAAVALALDWVDGRVARRTGTVTPLGARFDMEVDSFLILVLSVHVAREQGLWVLAIGLASYALLAAKRVLPWLRRPMPPRYWCKVVAAIQGIVLTIATAALLPHTVMAALLVLALTLLVESFGREVIWLSRMRYDDQLASEPTISRAA